MVRLMALDLDGTLLNDQKQVPESARHALQYAEKQGVTVAFCSGRNHADALYIAQQVGIPVWSITTNGAYLGHSGAEDALQLQPLPEEKAARIIAISHRFHGVPCVYTPLVEYNEAGYEEIVDYAAKQGNPVLYNPTKKEHLVHDAKEWEEILPHVAGQIMKCIVFLPNPDEFPGFEAALHEEGGLTVTTSIMFGGLVVSVEINREGVTKGGTLHRLQEHLGISPEETLIFGDSGNDLSMISCGKFLAMQNAQPEVQAQAWEITGDNNTDGVASAVYRLIK
ncbi:MAG: Cof-type HAD-IIB family hydrolase [Eubacteriales bacterium]|nr:Cof-type HAD-IIB family hydrolase [Eubacteriales bacterium]